METARQMQKIDYSRPRDHAPVVMKMNVKLKYDEIFTPLDA